MDYCNELCAKRSNPSDVCRLCEALKERDLFLHQFLHICGVFLIRRWAEGAYKAFTGYQGYTIFATLIAVYFGIHSIMVARHERVVSRAAFEVGTFFTMTSSEDADKFVAALKDFCLLQNISVPRYPHVLRPWKWGQRDTPNKKLLRRWASNYFPRCRPNRCGRMEDGSNYQVEGGAIRIDLRHANLKGCDLSSIALDGVALQGAIIDETTSILDKWRTVVKILNNNVKVGELISSDLSLYTTKSHRI
ncbi:MAG: hypothetical protein ACXABY_16325 [Candidatus Thorarchaeota archaeon]